MAAKPYDVTTKQLLELGPADWARFLGLDTDAPVEVVEADLAAVTSEADKVLRVAAASPWLVHVESQAGYDSRMPQRLLRYNALLDERHDCPVASILVLLRPEADGPAITGSLHRTLSAAPDYLDFRYGVVRMWDEPVDRILAGGLATLPLAPLAKSAPASCRR